MVPVWLIVAMTWLVVKVPVSVYSFAKGIVGAGLALLIIGTAVCYHDWKQIAFLLVISGVLLVVLLVGATIEVLLEMVRRGIGQIIL